MSQDSETQPASRASLLISVIGFLATSTVLVSLRLYIRLFWRKTYQWDDFLIFMAWLSTVYGTVTIQLAVTQGFGRHVVDIPPQNIPAVIKFIILTEFAGPLVVGFVKLSVVVTLLKLFDKSLNSRWFRWMCYLDLALFVPITLATCLLLVLQCIPLSAAWNETYNSDKCISRYALASVLTAQASFSGLSDLLTSILPIFILKNLQMRKSFKIYLCGLMGLGSVVTLCAMMRAITGQQLADNETDTTWTYVPVTVWFIAEGQVGIIIACLPFCTPLVLEAFKFAKVLLSRVRKRRSSDDDDDNTDQFSFAGPSVQATKKKNDTRVSQRNSDSDGGDDETTTDGDSVNIVIEDHVRSHTGVTTVDILLETRPVTDR